MNDCICFKNYKCLACERDEERKQAIAEGRKLNRKVAACGTRAGYNRHLKFKEPTCQAWKDAHKESVQQWQREKAAR